MSNLTYTPNATISFTTDWVGTASSGDIIPVHVSATAASAANQRITIGIATQSGGNWISGATVNDNIPAASTAIWEIPGAGYSVTSYTWESSSASYQVNGIQYALMQASIPASSNSSADITVYAYIEYDDNGTWKASATTDSIPFAGTGTYSSNMIGGLVGSNDAGGDVDYDDTVLYATAFNQSKDS